MLTFDQSLPRSGRWLLSCVEDTALPVLRPFLPAPKSPVSKFPHQVLQRRSPAKNLTEILTEARSSAVRILTASSVERVLVRILTAVKMAVRLLAAVKFDRSVLTGARSNAASGNA